MVKKTLLGILIVVLVLIGAFVLWGLTPAGPMDEALAALESDEQVTVQTDPWLIFEPVGDQPTTGLIYYPGGRVDYRSYAPYARDIAEQGYLVVIPSMPLSLAVLAPDRAAEIIAAYPEIDRWVVSGHSLGGSMAAYYAYENPEQVDGLVLFASYPADNNPLNETGLEALSISATLDGLSTPDDIAASQALLPADATFFPIEGGNHAQFGWYGDQRGDQQADISREEQQALAVQSAVAFLDGLALAEGQ